MTNSELSKIERYALMEVEAPKNQKLIQDLCAEIRRLNEEAWIAEPLVSLLRKREGLR